MKLLSLVLLFYSTGLLAKIKEIKIIDPQDKKFEYARVCRFKGISPAPIIEVKNSITLDCMGVAVKINDFCQEKSGGSLIKSFIDQENEQVVCQNGSGAKLKIACDKKHGSFCDSKTGGCERIHKIIAREIPLVHSSITSEDGMKTLNCYFLDGKGADYF
ncbi:MAG: hypothetical protein E2O68_07375 [Deltaproteobacteria bacterium]|nr:MAG: hypothetical protein E2O68_07375 [Deltaproteobacteria bacterium]